MTIWRTRHGWRFQFMYQGREYSKSGYKTKALALAAEAEKRREVKQNQIPTDTVYFSRVANEYLDFAQRKFATKTYKYKASVYREFIRHTGDLPLSQITVPILESYLRTRSTNVNYNRHRKDLCALFTWAWRRKYLPENPCFFLDKMPEGRFVRQIPTPQEMAAIMLAAGAERPLLLVLYHTLARVDEVLRLRWSDVNFTEKMVTLWTRKRKGGEWASRHISMNTILYETLWSLWQTRQQEEWVFLNLTTGTRYMKRPKLMKTICQRAGARRFGFHAIRHYVASHMKDILKISTAQISRILGHTTIETTERYLQVVDPACREAMKALEVGFERKFLSPDNDNGERLL